VIFWGNSWLLGGGLSSPSPPQYSVHASGFSNSLLRTVREIIRQLSRQDVNETLRSETETSDFKSETETKTFFETLHASALYVCFNGRPRR